MMVAQRLDEHGKGAWIFATALAFAVCWPVGVAALIFLSCSGRLHDWREDMRALKQDYRARRGDIRARWGCGGGWNNDRDRDSRAKQSGNAAFDEYRHETLRRLEEEQKAFEEYLDRLRAAKDKAEFDAFMAQRRGVAEA
jgi:hypothetical protein